MPTGYTAAIADGIEFNQFVWSCARAFGALVMMRDDPTNARIPERFEPSDTYAKWAEEERANIAKLESMSEEDAAIAAAGDYETALASWKRRTQNRAELLNKYNAMLAKVVQWVPPTSDHEGLQTFMADQIRESIKFDCDGKYDTKPLPQDGKVWRDQRLEHSRRMLARHLESQAEEVARVEGRNAWLRALRESVPPDPNS